MRAFGQGLFVALTVMLLALSGLAQASPPPPPPPPPPHPDKVSPPIDICRERSALLIERSYVFEIRPCTIVLGPKGRKLEVASTGGPGPFKVNGKQHRPTKVIFRAFVPVARDRDRMVSILLTGRTLAVRLPNRLPSVLNPYNITLPRSICREDGWLVSAAISDGTETKPFGVINSMCGPKARKR
ncbi:MAG: hypothetical protein ACKVRO_02635 [Micropepsaceae bacterium]